jgi:drug/metabolite transporter (DMT)-like permease
MSVAAVVLALAGAACYAVAATLQHRAAQQVRPQAILDPRLLVRLLQRPLFLLGGLADAAGTGFHAAALAFGPLALVQPLLVSGLVLAVPFEAALDRRRPDRRELLGVALSAAGLGTFVAVAAPEPGVPVPATGALVGIGAVIVAAVTGCLVVALRTAGPARATLLGIASGGLYALSAALAKICVNRIADTGLGVLLDPHLYALSVVGIAAVVLNQNAFQAGNLAGPLTGIALTDPLVSLAIARFAFLEHLSIQGFDGVVVVLAVTVMGSGVWLVSSSRSERSERRVRSRTT